MLNEGLGEAGGAFISISWKAEYLLSQSGSLCWSVGTQTGGAELGGGGVSMHLPGGAERRRVESVHQLDVYSRHLTVTSHTLLPPSPQVPIPRLSKDMKLVETG